MSEEKINPQPRRAEFNVNYVTNDGIGDIDQPREWGYKYGLTNNMTKGHFPMGYSTGANDFAGLKNGTVFNIPYQGFDGLSPQHKQLIYQYWYSESYGIYTRTLEKQGDYFFTNHTPWKEVHPDMSKYFTTPESKATTPNINEIKTSSVYKTIDSTGGTFPNDSHKYGILKTFMQQSDLGHQMWIGSGGDTKGKVYIRTFASDTWDGWREIGASSQSTQDLRNYITTPESTPQVQDLNSVTKSGLYRTDGQWADQHPEHYPQGISNRWGTLIHMFENDGSQATGGNKSCIQLFFAVHDVNNKLMWIRTQKTGEWSPWILLGNNSGGGIPVLPDEYFPATDEQPITNANAFTQNGFKRTTKDTSDLPPELSEDIESREGVIQFIQEHSGTEGTGIQYYVPVQGKYAGTTFTRVRRDLPVTRKGTRIQSQEWTDWTADNSNNNDLKINFNQVNKHTSPTQFLASGEHSGKKFHQKVFYNYFWKSGIDDSKLPDDVSTEYDFIVRTMVLAPNADEHNNRHSFVQQTAYSHDGKVLVRVNQDESTWKPWVELTGTGGGTLPSTFNLNEQLALEFKKWVSTPSETSQKEFTKYHNNVLKQNFEAWGQHTNEGKSTEQKAFEAYADKRYINIDEVDVGINFNEWAEYHKAITGVPDTPIKPIQ